MQFTVTQAPINEFQGDAIILFVPSEGELPTATATINGQLSDYVTQLQTSKDLTGKVAETLMVPQTNGPRLLFVGVGKLPMKAKDFTKALSAAAKTLKASAANCAAIDLSEIEIEGFDPQWAHKQIGQAFQDALYHFTECKSKKDDNPSTIEAITVIAENNDAELDLKFGQALAKGMAFTKKLGDMPPNVATPTYLADEADKLATLNANLTTKVLDEDKMEELGMGSFLSVAKGSIEPGKMICMEYMAGKAGDAPHVLVGKGITFDTGGISLKPGAGMDEMKYDMCGAASVLGTMLAIIELELPINFVGVIAAAENMPAGHASKPGDIVTAMNGTTIEILNTDAEGRLVLCDALTYAIETYKPASIVDIATLTGACMAALGRVNSGLFSEDDELVEELITASKTSQDAVWRLPLQDDYQELLDSNFADIANIGGPLAGATTAACFLSRFTKEQKWAHLDIAGTAWHSGGKNKGASGRPVPLLVNYLANKI